MGPVCGLAGGAASRGEVEAALDAMAHRGPDGRGVVEVEGWTLGHVRLAVIDPTPASAQPMSRGDVTLVYNGELFNYLALRGVLEAQGRAFSTSGDTEVLAWALDRWEAPEALARCDAMLGAAWVRLGRLHLARDRYGEVPLHYGVRPDGGVVFASELRGLVALRARPETVAMVAPGMVAEVDPAGKLTWRPYHEVDLSPSPDDAELAAARLRALLGGAVASRRVADRPVACLASGGLDSSAVAALLAPLVPGLRLYTAVYDRASPDLRHARLVADWLGLELVEVAVAAPSADDLAGVVRAIEMPSKAQTEIAWACLALARALQRDGVVVTFSGEGSDELWASYGMSYHGVRSRGWHRYRWESVVGQHRKNFARTNKVFMAHSVECRLPFLDPALVAYALRLSPGAVKGPGRGVDKAVLKAAVADLVPPAVSRRAKAAFQSAAGLDRAAAAVVADPARFYRASFAAAYPGVRP